MEEERNDGLVISYLGTSARLHSIPAITATLECFTVPTKAFARHQRMGLLSSYELFLFQPSLSACASQSACSHCRV